MTAVLDKTAAVQSAIDELSTLEDADAVAEYLRGVGVKGKPGKSPGCPLAVFFQRLVDGPAYVYIAATGWEVAWNDGGTPCSCSPDCMMPLGGTVHRVPLPDAVRDFGLAFDQGDYPDLIDHG